MKENMTEQTYEFAKRIVKLCIVPEEKSGVSKTLSSQLLRSGTSIGANIEEAVASQSPADFINKYSISCKEALETHFWLRLLSDTNIIEKEKLIDLTNECNEIIAILTTIIRKMKNK